jgi:hypothetical protein
MINQNNNRLRLIELVLLLLLLSNMTPGIFRMALLTVVTSLIFWNIGTKIGDFISDWEKASK